MSTIPTLDEPLSFLTGTDWREDFEFFLENENDPDDFTGEVIKGVLRVRTRTGERITRFSTTTGEITLLAANKLQVVLDKAVTAEMISGEYAFQLIVNRSNGVDEALLVGTVEVSEGY